MSADSLPATARRPHHIPPLSNFWYFGLNGASLKPGKMQHITLMGQSVLLGRTNEGKVFAMRNLCPHRSTPLHHGQFDGKEVQCHYHGWRFAADGRCTAIPALCDEQARFGERVRNKTYPCREGQGVIWVFMGDKAEDDLPDLPLLPGIGDAKPQIYCQVTYPLNAEHTAYTFFDPAHVAFVHSSPFIHRKSHNIRAKVKEFAPVPFGWCMKRHTAPRENMFYRLFGKNVTTEITYLLPGTRIEHIAGDKHWLISVATVSPISDEETIVHQSTYWSFPWMSPAKGLLRYLIKHFLTEDREYAAKQREGLAFQQPFISMGDADAQIQWFQRLRQAWLQSGSGHQPFVNPLVEETLRFNS
ncbi:MAG: aromatic ring-hydroxylating dioxygenase subunit alpha [Verrucomicrobiaceae bacterium]|nr:aromatic ring-hydroxylating dioxygenase subunit alpha [Verrucomicrobiaceae bacterium]